ncbi:hypothetical protein Mal4_56870 [Maioricimonas rarisocia]|uniref:Oxidoreductase family, NAD-binding Rossmann fold n=1 Tax=Maioricimonas rarisocia TaxID=2528026 RepID=A0A517ZFT5_9PLAN|nr:hypothetical protein [Maioricimonas rarisocia]QDU41321.1 hypothetical protein Mal4_56870 [Maioricimonas rarisocia]
MLDLGIIGPGPDWETRYRPGIMRHGRRFRVTAVYDPVPARAVHVAEELKAHPAEGIRALLRRPDVSAVLLLQTDWLGMCPLQFAVEESVPCLAAEIADAGLTLLQGLESDARRLGIVAMPGLPLRHMPASIRLRELIAARLGPAQDLSISAKLRGADAVWRDLAQLFDLATYVLQAAPGRVTAERLSPESFRARVEFHRRSLQKELHVGDLTLEIEHEISPLQDSPVQTISVDDHSVRIACACADGIAEIEGAARIHWSCRGQTQIEILKEDRTSFDVQLDHFTRRVVGGLIPVPDLSDLCRAFAAVQAVQQSLDTGETIDVNPC